MTATIAVLFDLDGTLHAHASAVLAATEAVRIRAAVPVEPTVFNARWCEADAAYHTSYRTEELSYADYGRERAWRAVSPELSPAAAQELFRYYLDVYAEHWELFDDVADCLAVLHDVPLGIVTNGRALEQHENVTRLGLRERMSCVLVSDEVGCWKPDARIFYEACRRLGVAPSAVVYVGDSWDLDVEGARGAGLHTVWLTRAGQSAPAGTSVPCIATLRELPGLVHHLGRIRASPT